MAEQMSALTQWGQGFAKAAGEQGFGMPSVPASGELRDFVGWAKQVSGSVGSFVSLPALEDDADYVTVLSWARSLDSAVRGYGLSLPPLPG